VFLREFHPSEARAAMSSSISRNAMTSAIGDRHRRPETGSKQWRQSGKTARVLQEDRARPRAPVHRARRLSLSRRHRSPLIIATAGHQVFEANGF
jgi:hypothetical protein